jgi:hypothetical protein
VGPLWDPRFFLFYGRIQLLKNKNMNKKIKQVLHELKHHTPFTALATIIAIFIVFFITYVLRETISENTFELSHFLHIIFSAMATAGIFYKYKPKVVSTIFVGITGAIIIGSISDVIFPYFGSILLNLSTSFHLPIIEEPISVLSFALLGSLIGMVMKETRLSHFVHVFLSVFASLFYILAFTTTFSLLSFVGIFFVVFLAVIIPCCLSDIVFPFFFISKREEKLS